MSGFKKFQFDHAQILYILDLGKTHEKTLRRSGDIKIFRLGRRMCMYNLPSFIDEALSEESEMGGNIPEYFFLYINELMDIYKQSLESS